MISGTISGTMKKYICVCLVLICVVSAAMTGTLAWSDYTQHKSNEFWGLKLTQEGYGCAELEKVDKKTGEPLQGAEFELYKVEEEENDTLIGTYITDEDGKIRVEHLEEGSYYWLETDPSYGYTYDRDINDNEIKKYPFEIAAGEDGEISLVTVRAYNERQKADLIIIKRVEELGGSISPQSAEIGPDDSAPGQEDVEKSAVPGEGPAKEEGDADTARIAAQGVDGQPEVSAGPEEPGAGEEPAVSGEPAEPGAGEEPDGQSETGGQEGADPGADPEGPVLGQDSGLQAQSVDPLDMLFKFTVTFEGLEDGPVTVLIDDMEYEMEIVDGKLTIELKHGQTAVIKDLPVGTVYTVEEEPADGYVVWSENEEGVIPPEGITVTFVNYYAGEKPGKLIVEKIVTGDDADLDKEFGFTVTINGEETTFVLKAGETKEFELPPNATYSVVEDDYTKEGYEPSYTTEYYVDDDGTVVIHVKQTNNYTGPVQIEIEGEKTWDLSGVNVVLPGSIIVYLKDGDVIVDTIVVTPDANGEWRYHFTAPKYREDGTEIVYTIEEVPIPGFYTTYNGYNIRNTYVPPETIVVPHVEKVVTGKPKDTVTFQFRLTALANAPMPEGSTNGQKTISITGTGEADFGQIKYDRVGTYRYTISEIIVSRTGWTYDRTVYNLTVTVTEHEGRLVAEKALTKADGAPATSGKAVFTNKYKKPEEPPKPPPEEPKPQKPDRPRTGDESNIWLWAIMMIVSAFALRFLLLYQRPARRQ